MMLTKEEVASVVVMTEPYALKNVDAEVLNHIIQKAAELGLAKAVRIIETANRLVDHADFKLGGALSADSKAKDIPSKAVSQVKARHLAALRDALSAHGIKE